MGTSIARRAFALRRKCDRVVCHVFGTALSGSVNWPWSTERVMGIKRWEAKILRLTFRPKRKAGEDWVEYRKRTSGRMRAKWRKMQLATTAQKNVEKVWKTVAWAVYDGDVPVMKALRSILSWRTTAWWRHKSAWGMRVGPTSASGWKDTWGVHTRGVVWDTLVVRWAGEGHDWVKKKDVAPAQKRMM